jgi:hypothetical protein
MTPKDCNNAFASASTTVEVTTVICTPMLVVTSSGDISANTACEGNHNE